MDCTADILTRASSAVAGRHRRFGYRRWVSVVSAVVTMVVLATPCAAGNRASTSSSSSYGVANWLLFPAPSSSVGLFLALAIPLDLVNQDVTLSYNFEGNYDAPANVTKLQEMMDEYGYRRSHAREQRHVGGDLGSLRDFSRAHAYAMIQGSIARSGTLPGRACLLRAVCEAAEWPMERDFLGSVLHVLLTPSSSTDPDLSPDFHAAERHGRRGADCSLLYKACPVSLLGLLTEQ